MSARHFPSGRIQHGDRTVATSVIECKCGVVAHFKQTGTTRKPPEAAEQYFRAHGWTVGPRATADRCPDCTARLSKPVLKVVPMEAKPETPREMSREDRRIIFAKVDELYLDDKTGYAAPWTDSAVARDLGVPRAWVAQVREELFGPEGSNAEFDDFLAKAAPVIADMKNLCRSATAQLEEARRLSERVDELERIARRVEREIGKAS